MSLQNIWIFHRSKKVNVGQIIKIADFMLVFLFYLCLLLGVDKSAKTSLRVIREESDFDAIMATFNVH